MARRRRWAYRSLNTEQRAEVLVAVTEELLEFFALVDTIFEDTDEALSAEKRQMVLGKIYEGWKRTRKALDPAWRSPGQRGTARRR